MDFRTRCFEPEMPLSIRCLNCEYLIFYSTSIGTELASLRKTFEKCPDCGRVYDWDSPEFTIETK